ncbi:MAG: hypothetical protein ABSH22_10395 [Tepidisphaeraceae bacterium]|jgi:hypothetical protein
MSATELIKQVAALPQQERTLFEHLFDAMKKGGISSQPVNDSNWPDFGQRLRRIYGDRIASDSQNIIDEGRRDADTEWSHSAFWRF